MRCLFLIEHDGGKVRSGSLAGLGAALRLASESGGECRALVLGHQISPIVESVRLYVPTVSVESDLLVNPLADRDAAAIHAVCRAESVECLLASSSTYAKDVLPRACALLEGAMASEVVTWRWEESELLLKRPMYAGSFVATVKLHGKPKVMTLRATSADTPEEAPSPCSNESFALDTSVLPQETSWEKLEASESERPDVAEARIVVSGGRAFENRDDFERLVGGLADVLGGAAGSSRVLVDAGITGNDLQVGQTGKVVTPELYVALGISGAIQHLAGMRGSKVIVAVNQDEEAPIFDVADYGLVGDVYEIVPQLIERLQKD